MLQAVMTNPGKVEFREITKPIPANDEVLIQIKRIGVCGSDIHVYHGLHPYTSYPVVQGHEVAGVVAEIGKDVTGFVSGDKVVFMPQVTCGVCYPCQHGMYHICDSLKVMGFQTNGAAQEFFAVQAANVLKLPESISLDQAALSEPNSVAVHCLSRAGSVEGQKVLVLGPEAYALAGMILLDDRHDPTAAYQYLLTALEMGLPPETASAVRRELAAIETLQKRRVGHLRRPAW